MNKYLSESIDLTSHIVPLVEIVEGCILDTVRNWFTPSFVTTVNSNHQFTDEFSNSKTPVQDLIGDPAFYDSTMFVFSSMFHDLVDRYITKHIPDVKLMQIGLDLISNTDGGRAEYKRKYKRTQIRINRMLLEPIVERPLFRLDNAEVINIIQRTKKNKKIVPILNIFLDNNIKNQVLNHPDLVEEANETAHRFVSVLVHELTHAVQYARNPNPDIHNSKEYIKSPEEYDPEYNRRVWAGKTVEIGAHSHNISHRIIRALNNTFNWNTIDISMFPEIETRCNNAIQKFSKLMLDEIYPTKTAKEIQVVNRYRKLVYQFVNNYLNARFQEVKIRVNKQNQGNNK